MNQKTILVAAAACFAGFVAGFMLANTLNRNQLAAPPASPQSAIVTPGSEPASAVLSPEELKAKVEAADNNPTNFGYQKSLGLSLYRYASLKQDAALLPDAIRIMQRAQDLDPADRDLQIGLGNAHFDLGYFNKDNAAFDRARGFYNKALTRVPSDVDVRTDLALTYFLSDPPDFDRAAAEFEKGLAINPKHERSMQFLIQTYLKQNNVDKAAGILEKLKAANPSNPAIPELANLIAGGPTEKQ